MRFSSCRTRGILRNRVRWNAYHRMVDGGCAEKSHVVTDQVVLLGNRTGARVVRDPETGKELALFTSHLEFAASTIALIYRNRLLERWVAKLQPRHASCSACLVSSKSDG